MRLFALVLSVMLPACALSQMNLAEENQLQVRIHGDASLPTLVYLPGLHGDWTLAGSFRNALAGKVRFVEFTYPRTLTWSLNDYARAVENVLQAHGITDGWLLGESFGSQIVWPMATASQNGRSPFTVHGIILAGGFVRHPNKPGIQTVKGFTAHLPRPCFDACLSLYRNYAKMRHRRAPETLADIDEFVARRTDLDRQAMNHRLCLIETNDVRNDVKASLIPVYALSGFWDPIVPRILTRLWLRKNCPSYREAKTIFSADHNVLGTQPQKSADVILNWINGNKKGRS